MLSQWDCKRESCFVSISNPLNPTVSKAVNQTLTRLQNDVMAHYPALFPEICQKGCGGGRQPNIAMQTPNNEIYTQPTLVLSLNNRHHVGTGDGGGGRGCDQFVVQLLIKVHIRNNTDI